MVVWQDVNQNHQRREQTDLLDSTLQREKKMQSNMTRRQKRKVYHRSAVLELLDAVEKLPKAIQKIQQLENIIYGCLETCWSCAQYNIVGSDVCIHCGDIMDPDEKAEELDRQIEMENQAEREKHASKDSR